MQTRRPGAKSDRTSGAKPLKALERLLKFNRVLIANRGEIAIRVARALQASSTQSVAVFSEDDAQALHVRRADQAIPLRGRGAAAYLDIEGVIAAARATQCEAIHPGYGFLSENAAFAAACRDAGLVFVGPDAQTIALFGDKARARDFARKASIPTVQGIDQAVSLQEAIDFFRSLGSEAAVMLKAISGGGGRGIRIVRSLDALEEAYERCRSEARATVGNGDLYIERYLPRARHLEVQILGDGETVAHLWERECTLQRQHQKIIEIAPSPGLPVDMRERLIADALRLAKQARYKGLGTVEFLVWERPDATLEHAFIEVNPRIQVEHTVTEAITGIDLVSAQLRIAAGARLAELGLDEVRRIQGFAIQARVNTERLAADGKVLPATGQVTVFEPPCGPGVRVDTCGHTGFRTAMGFDSLLAKVIVHSTEPVFAKAVQAMRRALAEFRVEGVQTSIGLLQALLEHPDVQANNVHTRFLDEHAPALAQAAARYEQAHSPQSLAAEAAASFDDVTGPGKVVRSPVHATVTAVHLSVGDVCAPRTPLLVLEAMKMEHVIELPQGGRLMRLDIQVGDTVLENQPLAWVEELAADDLPSSEAAADQGGRPHPDLQALFARRLQTRDEARPEAVARRRSRGQRTARENIEDLCDAGSFLEYGSLVVAAQRARHPLDHLIKTTPADGFIAGLGCVNGQWFDPQTARCAVMAYDATVLAGTQGREGYRKAVRTIELAERLGLPVVVYAEGGGARPGDTEKPGEHITFNRFARLSGKVPLVGVISGLAFAGNAALLGVCDVIIATENASYGMGGPAMVEGGGLGVFPPHEIGPARMHYSTGCADILVKDEAEATDMARRYLSYFQGPIPAAPCPDQALLRNVIPADRRRAYQMRDVIDLLADEGSVLELKGGFGRSLITALIRVEGHAVGVVANNPAQLGGAIDADAADKGARFLQLCDAFGLPVLQLCDTPGVLVGPVAEKTALVRHSSRMMAVGANMQTPSITIVIRKAYGLGMVSMMGGAQKAPMFNIAWPTAEYGAMGIEGAVQLGYRKELAAISDPQARQAFFDQRVEELYAAGKALNKATTFDFDEVIDPAESRRWILSAIEAAQRGRASTKGRHPFVTPW
ncbi:MAG: carboxyl transferase domain-containing protein [Ramlibacter sp.]